MKTVLLNGVIVGEAPVTGDYDRDIEAARQVLKDKGVYKPVSRFQAMHAQAAAFANTSAYLYERDLKRPPRKGTSAAPFVVNASFSIEVYLKALAQKHGLTLRGHELTKLYKALPKPALAEIDAVIPRCAANRALDEEPDLPQYLRELNDTFVKWRYCYEHDRAGQVRIEPIIFVMEVLHEACRLQQSAVGGASDKL